MLHDLERRTRARVFGGPNGQLPVARARLVSDESTLIRDEGHSGLRTPRHARLDHDAWRLDSGRMATASGALRLRLIFGAATVLGFFSAFTAYYYVTTFAQRGKPASFPFLLLLNLNYWYSWALLTPGILWLARRFPFERDLAAQRPGARRRRVRQHAGARHARDARARLAIYTWCRGIAG